MRPLDRERRGSIRSSGGALYSAMAKPTTKRDAAQLEIPRSCRPSPVWRALTDPEKSAAIRLLAQFLHAAAKERARSEPDPERIEHDASLRNLSD